MRKGITTDVLFWVLIFFIVIIIFVGVALWSKGYGLNVLNSLLSLIP